MVHPVHRVYFVPFFNPNLTIPLSFPNTSDDRARMGYKNFPFMSLYEGGASTDIKPSKGRPLCYTTYDPTNGTVSLGDVYRFGGEWQSGWFMLDGQVIGMQTSPGGNVW